MRHRPRIVILGGGIGGLAAAAFLHRQGLPATVYEQAPRLREVGAGLVVAPNAARQLRRLGALGTFCRRAVQLEVGWEFRRWEDGTVLSAESLTGSCEELYGEQTYTAHRADLLAAVAAQVPAGSVQLGRRAVGVERCGFTLESWTATATVEEFLAEFEGWDPRLVDLIRASGTPGRWALVDRQPLARWSQDGITLLGDAAHPMFPFFAQGAAQALEDASVLALCLADGIDDPSAALRRYETVRIPRTTRLQTISHGRAHINHLPDGPEQRERDARYAQEDPLVANGWIYGYDPSYAGEVRPD